MCKKSRVLFLVIGLILSTTAAVMFGFTDTELPWSVYMTVWMAGFGLIRLSSRGHEGERRV